MRRFKYISLLTLQFLISANCFAQQETIDSLKKVLPSLQDSARIDCLNSLSKAYSLLDADTAGILAMQVLHKAEMINYTKGSAQAYNNLAWIKWIRGDNYPEMERYCGKAIALLEKTPEKEQLANAWYLLGLASSGQGNFSSAIQAYEKAGRLFLEAGDELSFANMYSFMASAEENRGQYERSLQYSVKWLDLAKKHNSSRYLDVWADLYKNAGDYQTALDYYRQAAQQAQANQVLDEFRWFTLMMGEVFLMQKNYDSAGYYYHLALNYNPSDVVRYSRLAELHLALHQYDSALFYLKNALALAEKANSRNQIMWMLLRLSRAYQEKGTHKKALQQATVLLRLARETGARQYVRDAHFLLYGLLKKLKKERGAFMHLQHYTVLKDAIDKDLSAQKLAFYKTQGEREKAQAGIDLLNKEKQLQQQQLKQTKLQKNFLIAGITVLLLMGVVLFRNILLRRKNEKLKLENELKVQQLESQKQLSELEMQALRAQMNPHFIFNSLNSINRFILQNDKAKASEYLTKFSRLVRLILQNSQAALILLESELEGLKLYLELEAARFNHQFEYKIIVHDDLDTDILKVPPLIIQPYAENAIWHGLMHKEEEGHLEIELFQCDEVLCCKITDDGVGRQRAAELKSKSASTHKSMGMRITADRIAMLQEKKQIDATIQITDLILPDGSVGGTEVLLKLPVML